MQDQSRSCPADIEHVDVDSQVTPAHRNGLRIGQKPAALEGFRKAQAHTALADIHESIDELLHYRRHLLAV